MELILRNRLLRTIVFFAAMFVCLTGLNNVLRMSLTSLVYQRTRARYALLRREIHLPPA